MVLFKFDDPDLPKEVKFLMVDYPTKGIIASQLLGGYKKETSIGMRQVDKMDDEEGIQQEDLDADIKQWVDPDYKSVKKGKRIIL